MSITRCRTSPRFHSSGSSRANERKREWERRLQERASAELARRRSARCPSRGDTARLGAGETTLGAMKVTYIGHATLLLELGGARLLTDPNFDSKLGRILPRVSAPGIALEQLPALDAILLTHA